MRVTSIMAGVLFMGLLTALAICPSLVDAKPRGELQGVLNLNSATIEQFMELPGIGHAKAQAILGYRNTHSFLSVQELGEIKGIGPRMLQKLTPYLVLEGETTLRRAEVKSNEVGQTPAPQAPEKVAR